MGVCKFGNNTYPGCIRRRSNLGHIFGKKCASYGPGNTVTQFKREVFHNMYLEISTLLG